MGHLNIHPKVGEGLKSEENPNSQMVFLYSNIMPFIHENIILYNKKNFDLLLNGQL